jgi:hypothetical protein
MEMTGRSEARKSLFEMIAERERELMSEGAMHQGEQILEILGMDLDDSSKLAMIDAYIRNIS